MIVSRNWLQKYFSERLPNVQELGDIFMAHSFEVEEVKTLDYDELLDIDILPNRSSDCLCHRGIAKELSTVLGVPLKTDPFREPIPTYSKPASFTVSVEDEKLCGRYMAGIMRGVHVGPSPVWLVKALESVGQKSINNIVDATNYVMFNLGQPVHVFDFSKLAQDEEGNRNITVRLAKKGERIVTLTGDAYTLNETHQLITDGVSGTPLALAGIKGGKEAEIDEQTVDIVIEVANFHPVVVRKTSKDLKLQTDASLRFQNEPSPNLCSFAMKEVLELIASVGGAKEAGVIDVFSGYNEKQPIEVTLTEINSLLSLSLSVDDVEDILMRLGWEFSLDREEFAVTGPWERTDIVIKESVIEEIGRLFGYKNITSLLPPKIQAPVHVNKNYYYTEKIQEILSSMGYSEVLTYTLVGKGEVEILNPLASDKSFLRTSLREGMEKALELNNPHAPLLGLDMIKIFEVGTVFTAAGERLALSVGARSPQYTQKKTDAMVQNDVKAVLDVLGSAVTPHVEQGVCEVDLHPILPLLPSPIAYESQLFWDTNTRFTPWSTYPYILRDIAVWVPGGTESASVFEVIRGKATELLVRGDLFDTYEKDGRVSYAWHLVFQSFDRTLTDVEIGAVMDEVILALESQKGWEVR